MTGLDDHGQAPSVRAVCLECGTDLGHLGLTAGNVAAKAHRDAEHAGRETFFRAAVLVIPDELPGNAVMQVPVGRPWRTVPLTVDALRAASPTLRARLVAKYEIGRLAAAGRMN